MLVRIDSPRVHSDEGWHGTAPAGINSREDVLKMGIGNYNEECRSIVMKCELIRLLMRRLHVSARWAVTIWRWFPSVCALLQGKSAAVRLLVQVLEGVGEDGDAPRPLDRLRERLQDHGPVVHGERVVGVQPTVGQGPRLQGLQGADRLPLSARSTRCPEVFASGQARNGHALSRQARTHPSAAAATVDRGLRSSACHAAPPSTRRRWPQSLWCPCR